MKRIGIPGLPLRLVNTLFVFQESIIPFLLNMSIAYIFVHFYSEVDIDIL